jgi:multidrug efflux pump subunit AcrA (membrane-fusion protein)
MKKRAAILLGGVLIAMSGAAAFATLGISTQEASAVSDPRQEPPIVRLAMAARVTGSERGFTGVIAAKVQSNLGFRVAGKIVERLVDVGQQVKAGQPLMRIDETDLRLALTAKRNAVAAARAIAVQAEPDERRYAKLLKDGWTTRQRYEQAKAALDSLYGGDGRRYSAHLRQLSNSADTQTRTYEARYVLDGEAAAAPLGATVTIRLAIQATHPEVEVPLGAVLDDGEKTGVWVLDSATSTVHFQPVQVVRVTSETAVVSGLNSSDQIVSLGAHLLQEGARVRTASDNIGNR